MKCPCQICGQKEDDPNEGKCRACRPKEEKKETGGAGGGGEFTRYGSRLQDNIHYTWKYALPD